MSESYLSRFLDVIVEHDGGVLAGPYADGRHRLVEYYGRRYDPPIVLDFDEAEFDAAVLNMGQSSRSLWPESPPGEVGLRLALVHLQESMDPERPPPSRMRISASGLVVE